MLHYIALKNWAAALHTQSNAMKEATSQFETKIALLKREINGLHGKGQGSTKVNVPDLKPFNSTRSAIWRSTPRLLRFRIKNMLPSHRSCGGGPDCKMMMTLVEGRLIHGKH